jgi:hypothetical protein
MSDIESHMQKQLWSKIIIVAGLLWILLLVTNTIATTDSDKIPQPQPNIENQKLVEQQPLPKAPQQIPLVAVANTSTNAETVVKETKKVETKVVEKKVVSTQKKKVVVKPKIVEIKEVKGVINYDISKMPYWKEEIKGTDKWDGLIIEISKEKGIDPVFLKCIMAIESGGYQKTLNTTNKNGTHDYGLMQVNTSWGDRFDYKKMLSNPRYAISCGADVVLCKIASAKQKGMKPTAFNIFWLHNGYSNQGKKYAQKVSVIFNAFSNKNANEIITIS